MRTLSQTTKRFHKPTMQSSAAEYPTQAFLSLMATTYMKCKMNSSVMMHTMKRAR